jgi:hypothetical protein
MNKGDMNVRSGSMRILSALALTTDRRDLI